MPNPQHQTDTVYLNYYDGAYGPTIRIDANSAGGIRFVKKLIFELALSAKSEVKLHQEEDIVVDGNIELVLSAIPSDKEQRKALFRLKREPETTKFLWARTPAGWAESAAQLDGLINSQKPGHQYLTDEQVDDALVIIAMREIKGGG